MEKEIKIITLGASEVGKTSIINRIVNKKFSENAIATQGTDRLVIFRDYKQKNIKIKLIFIDTAGQERYANLPIKYIRNCQIVLLVYSNLKNLEELKNRWFTFYKENSNCKKSKFIIVANKSDLFGEKRDIIRNSGKEFSEEINNAYFTSVSAKSDDNIDNLEDYILIESKDIIEKELKSKSYISNKTKNNIQNIEKKTYNNEEEALYNNINVQIKTGTCCS